MNAIDMLITDHDKVSQLFEEFEAHPELSIAERIFMEIELHAQLEEEIFYPAVQQVDPELVADSLDDHDKVKKLIGVLRGLDINDQNYNTQMEELRANVEDHVDEEETELFPEVEQQLSSQIEQLGDKMLKRKQELQRGGASRTASA